MRALDRKLFRDLARMKAQAIAIALVGGQLFEVRSRILACIGMVRRDSEWRSLIMAA
jgi:hypothetical protein